MAAQSVAIVGPTACGKTHRAVALAKALNGEVISADSRQVYRGMSIGTGKDLSEYEDVSYHLIDIVDAGSKFNLYQYLKQFHAIYNTLISRNVVPVICGGSGMYVENALRGVRLPDVPENPELRTSLSGKSLEELTNILSRIKTLHNKTDVDTTKRAIRAIEIQNYYLNHPDEAALADVSLSKPLDCIVFGIDIPRDVRRARISKRLEDRLNDGMIDEVRSLLDSGISPDSLIYYGLEYKFVTLYLIGKSSYDEMLKGLETAIHQFAKRQMTWFRGMESRGIKINWLPYDISDDEFIESVRKLLISC